MRNEEDYSDDYDQYYEPIVRDGHRQVDARTGTGRMPHKLSLEENEVIGSGAVGTVRRIKAVIHGKELRLAAKSYDNDEDFNNAKEGFRLLRASWERERAENPLARSTLLPTIRFDSAGRQVLTTLLGTDGRKVVSVNRNESPGRSALKISPLERIPNFDAFLAKILNDAEERGKDGVIMGGDSAYFLVSEDGNMEYVTGDLEGVGYAWSTRQAVINNLVSFAWAIELFLKESTIDAKPYIATLLREVRRRVDPWVAREEQWDAPRNARTEAQSRVEQLEKMEKERDEGCR
jgi:hypothetical protein